MSITVARDALVNLLNSDAYFGTGHAGVNYHILEQAPGPGIVVSWVKLTNTLETEASALGRFARRLVWTLLLDVFVKDEGDADLLMDRVHDNLDTINLLLYENPTLADTVEIITEVRAFRTPGEARSAGGAVWLPFTVELDVWQWQQPGI